MRSRLLVALIAASCALAACGAARKQAEPVPPDLSPTPVQRLTEPPADQLPALMVDLSRRARGRAVSASEVAGAVEATCAKGTSASLKAFIRERLPDIDVGAAALFGRVVALIDAQCPLAPGQVLSLQSAALAELALNGLRASAHGTIREAELNRQACAVMLASQQSVGASSTASRGRGRPRPEAAKRARDRRQGRGPGVPGLHRRSAPGGRGPARPLSAGTAGRRGCSNGMRRAIVLATLAAVVLPAAASAKEVAALTVCGSNGCQKITAHAALQGFMNGGYETLAPERAAPFFTVRVAMRHAGDDAGGWTVEYLRAANLIRATGDDPSTCGHAPPA